MRPDGHNILTSSDGSLILNNVKPSDEGTYTCNAYTGIYSVSATAEVRVTKDTQQGEKDTRTLMNIDNFQFNLDTPPPLLLSQLRAACCTSLCLKVTEGQSRFASEWRR